MACKQQRGRGPTLSGSMQTRAWLALPVRPLSPDSLRDLRIPFLFFLLLFAFIFCSIYSRAIRFCFFSFFWDIFFFRATSSSGLVTICSFSVRIISMWQGELMYGLIRPRAV